MAEQISTEELAAAFGGSVNEKNARGGRDETYRDKDDARKDGGGVHGREVKNAQTNTGKNKAVSLVVLIIGLIMLTVGVAFLVLGVKRASLLADGDFLVSAGEWRLAESETCAENECKDTVIWAFSEIGKGTLTTNGHKNDYDFKWAIRDEKLVIETDWLYELDNEYEYTIDHGARVLTLKGGEKEYKFIAEGQE